MKGPVTTYSVHDGDVGLDREIVLGIWRGNLGQEERTAAKYDWFYLRSPSGPPLLKRLRHEADRSWIGTCALGARRMLLQGRPLRAGLQVDLAVAAGHRSLGPALLLQQSLLASAASRFDFLYGFPNSKARALFKRLDWTKIAELVRYTRILRHRTYLQRRMPGIAAAPLGWLLDAVDRLRQGMGGRHCDVQWSGRVDPRMDALWASSCTGDALVTIRNVEYLRWRFDECPLAKTRYLLLSDKAGGELLAWFATEINGSTLRIRDVWSTEGTRGVGRRHLDVLISAARAEGHDAISVEIAAEPAQTESWRARGFVVRDRRPVYGLTPHAETLQGPITPYLTAADEDE
jgi:hypothetical protein